MYFYLLWDCSVEVKSFQIQIKSKNETNGNQYLKDKTRTHRYYQVN